MYRILLAWSLLYPAIECASYQRYGESTYQSTYQYPSSTIGNYYNNNPYRTVNYGSDIANYPEGTRYPNYNPTYSTTRYPYSSYSTDRYNSLYGGGSNVDFNLNQGFNGQRYGEPYLVRPTGGIAHGIQDINTYNSYEAPFMRELGSCVNRSPQNGIWVDSLMGMWYGVELIQHMGADTRIDYARTCIVIHIAEPRDPPSTENLGHHAAAINAKFRQQYRHLRLLWDEAGQTSEYGLYFRNETAGYWHAFDGQNGTLTSRNDYNQFSGTVQVLKAVNDHMLLNFCQEPGMNGRLPQLYSVLFSRYPGQLNQWEIDAVHNLLQNKRLSVASRRMVCGNSADKPLYSIIFSILTFLLAYVVGSS